MDTGLCLVRLDSNLSDVVLVFLKLLGQMLVLLEHGLNILQQLSVAIQALSALVDDSLQLVRDILFVLLQNHSQASLMSRNDGLRLQEEREKCLLLLSKAPDLFKVLLA